MFDAAGVAALDELKSLIFENDSTQIDGLAAGVTENTAGQAVGDGLPADLASPVFPVPASGLRNEFSAVAEDATLQEIPVGTDASESSVYALSGAYSLPFLQGNPIGYVWQAPTKEGGLSATDTQEYFKALNEDLTAGAAPQSEAERLVEALTWQADVSGEMEELEAAKGEGSDMTDDFSVISKDLTPHVLKQGEAIEKALENIDLDTADETLENDTATLYDWKLGRLDGELRLAKQEAEWDRALAGVDRDLDALERGAEQDDAFFEAAQTRLDLGKSEDIFSYDLDEYLLYSDFEHLHNLLWMDDMRDMGTMLDATDAAMTEWMEENADVAEFDQPLDNGGDFAQSRNGYSEFGDDVSDLLEKLDGNALNKAKDRK